MRSPAATVSALILASMLLVPRRHGCRAQQERVGRDGNEQQLARHDDPEGQDAPAARVFRKRRPACGPRPDSLKQFVHQASRA